MKAHIVTEPQSVSLYNSSGMTSVETSWLLTFPTRTTTTRAHEHTAGRLVHEHKGHVYCGGIEGSTEGMYTREYRGECRRENSREHRREHR